MSVLVDAGVFVAQQNQRDRDHAAARRSIEVMLSGGLGQAVTTDYVFDEAVTLTRMRTHSHAEAMTVARRILGIAPFPRVMDLHMVASPVFREALRILERYHDRPLSFTDATTIALAQRRRVDHVLSFDRDFDGIVPRLDPREAPWSF